MSHHAAAALWGVRPCIEGDIDITVVGGDCGRRRQGIRVHRISSLQTRDARHRHGIPVTSPARTLLDIAPEVSDRALERALDEALVQALVSHAAINATLAAYPHRPGSGRLRTLVDPGRPTTATNSGAEEAFLALARRAKLPVPEVNARLGRYTADFLWRREKVILEVDGYDYHRTRAAFERDRRRDAEHQVEDFLVVRASAGQVEREHEALLVHVATILQRRRAAGA